MSVMTLRQDHRYKIILGALMIIYAVLFFWLAQLRYRSFFSYEWEDQAEVNRLCWNISQGKFADLYGQMMSHGTYYKFHFLWIFFVVAPLYILYPHIQTIFFIVSGCLAVSAWPVYLIALRILKSGRLAFLLAVSYLLYAPKHSLNFLDGDPIIFMIPLLLFAFYAAITARTKWLYFFMALVLLCKTESSLFVAMMGVYLALQRKQLKITAKTCFLLFFSGVGFYLLNLYFYERMSTDSLFNGLYKHSFSGAVGHAWYHARDIFSGGHARTFFQLFWPVGFLPVFSAELYMGLPSLALIALTQHFVFQRAHYIAGAVPFIFIGTIYVVRRFQDRPRLQLTLSFLVLAGCIASNFGDNIIGTAYPPEAGLIKDARFTSAYNIFDKRFYAKDEDDRKAWTLIGMIPPDAPVAASGDLLVPLSSRAKVYEFLDDRFDYYDVDYILLHNRHVYMGAGHYEWDDARMKTELDGLLQSRDWMLLAQAPPFFLFKRIKEA